MHHGPASPEVKVAQLRRFGAGRSDVQDGWFGAVALGQAS
jgi:hypothetical protein